MRTGETDVISVQKDAGRIAVLAHMQNRCVRLKLLYLTDTTRQGAAAWTQASLANAALQKMAEGFCK